MMYELEYVVLQVAALKNTGPSGVSDAAFSSLFDENTRLREQCAPRCQFFGMARMVG